MEDILNKYNWNLYPTVVYKFLLSYIPTNTALLFWEQELKIMK